MTIPVQDRLDNLLPALYRIRDNEPGQSEALRALMALIEEQFLALEADVDQLYDDAFIETCQEWVVPYLGDLLGVKPLQDIAQTSATNNQTSPYSQRTFVANALAYRQRKGTATVLEQLARDVTNWPARAVEYFQRLEWTQHGNHLRPGSWRTPDLRDTSSLALLNTPFETAQHTPEIRHIDNGRGKYNLAYVGIHLWRLQAYPLEKVQAKQSGAGLYWINPLGHNQALFNAPEPEASITTLATEINVPTPLRRRPLYDEIEDLVAERSPLTQYFGKQPPFQIYLNNEPEPVAPTDLMICDLSGNPDAVNTNWQRLDPDQLIEENAASRRIAVDPHLGRLAIPLGQPIPEQIAVSYAYGFSGDIGGGAYDRRASVSRGLSEEATWEVGVSSRYRAVGNEVILTDLVDAINQWNAQPSGTRGVIILMDNDSYSPGVETIHIPEGSELLMVAAAWPLVTLKSPNVGDVRRSGQWVPVGQRSHIQGNLSVQGTAAINTPNPGRLILDGLLIEGNLTIKAGNLEQMRLAHCTLVPDQGGIVGVDSMAEGQTNNRLTVEIDHSITGPIAVPQTVGAIVIKDSIIDADGAIAITSVVPDQAAPVTTIRRSTIFGSSYIQAFQLASEVIFTGQAIVQRRQVGCVRFSYVPPDSQTPRRYRCQPDLDDEAISDADDPGAQIIVPSFTSSRYGDPAYGQLSRTCPISIRTGAEDGSEMGAFSFLKQPQREANLRNVLSEYLRFGLEAGIFYVN